MGYDQLDCSFALIILFSIFKNYVIRLHRVSIGEGEIQGAKEKKANTRRTNEEIVRFIVIISFYWVVIHALLPRVGPKLVSMARGINVV